MLALLIVREDFQKQSPHLWDLKFMMVEAVDLQVAEKNAIKAASEKAVLELVSQLAKIKIYIRKDKKNE